MFKKIVVPVDLSDRHERTLAIAAELARAAGGDVTLLHVVELASDLTPADEPEFYGKLERRAHAHLVHLGRALGERGVPWKEEVLFGHRVEVIVTRAAELKADLLLLSSHRVVVEQGVKGWGTQSYKVSILAQCPVMLVK